MKKYKKPLIINRFKSNNIIPLAAISLAEVGAGIAAGAAMALMGSGRRDIYSKPLKGLVVEK